MIFVAATSGGAMRIYVNGLSSGGSVVIGNLWSGAINGGSDFVRRDAQFFPRAAG